MAITPLPVARRPGPRRCRNRGSATHPTIPPTRFSGRQLDHDCRAVALAKLRIRSRLSTVARWRESFEAVGLGYQVEEDPDAALLVGLRGFGAAEEGVRGGDVDLVLGQWAEASADLGDMSGLQDVGDDARVEEHLTD